MPRSRRLVRSTLNHIAAIAPLAAAATDPGLPNVERTAGELLSDGQVITDDGRMAGFFP